MSLRGVRVNTLLWHALQKWSGHRATTRSAAIAFYSLTSLAPMSLLLVWIGATAWESTTVQERIISEISRSAGPETAALASSVIREAAIPLGDALLPSTIAIIIFAFSATAVLSQLQAALSDIWESPPRPEGEVIGFLRRKLVALLLIGAVGVVLLVSMAVSVVVAMVTARLEPALPTPLLGLGQVAISSVTLIALFTVILRLLPDAEVKWSEAALGGVVTGLLHFGGQWVVGVYLGRAAVGSAYGAAASLVVFMSWVYYSSAVFLYGAEVTRALSGRLRVDG